MDKKTQQIIDEMKCELKDRYPDFRGIYLFGSRIRGKHSQDSDYDLVLIFDRKIDWKFDREISRIIYNYDLKYDIFIDNYLYNMSDIINPITPLRENVKNEGVFFPS